eukprot:gnl/TRDRNA2_/TRDRNA2_44572_c0_seq1.p1 gnl/TRDRNA2_/TRDRNA2_44572_c0~~gnl/TRDRNA2_/TRDRNA2_44572_c0_seq1.p1  ORF type:complete len:278 (-),score=48.51 gnl/TRDRNA2_/TRDRNA2_44572_c0_seq1:90-923(-)
MRAPLQSSSACGAFGERYHLLITEADHPVSEPVDDSNSCCVSVASGISLAALRIRIADIVQVPEQQQVLYFQNAEGTHSVKPTLLSDDWSLGEQGVRDRAVVFCHKPTFDKQESKQCDSLYYMWTANERRVPDELRYANREAHGVPERLHEDAAHSGAVESISGSTCATAKPTRPISNYSFVDEGKHVKVYVASESEGEAVAAASNDTSSVESEFLQDSFHVAVLGPQARHLLAVEQLTRSIIPTESKVRVSAGKRITITLAKEKKDVTWHSLVRKK